MSGRASGLAVININEENLSQPEQYSWRDLREYVRSYADALRLSGLQKGEVVARKNQSLPLTNLAFSPLG